jgi:hypothetical protein
MLDYQNNISVRRQNHYELVHRLLQKVSIFSPIENGIVDEAPLVFTALIVDHARREQNEQYNYTSLFFQHMKETITTYDLQQLFFAFPCFFLQGKKMNLIAATFYFGNNENIKDMLSLMWNKDKMNDFLDPFFDDSIWNAKEPQHFYHSFDSLISKITFFDDSIIASLMSFFDKIYQQNDQHAMYIFNSLDNRNIWIYCCFYLIRNNKMKNHFKVFNTPILNACLQLYAATLNLSQYEFHVHQDTFVEFQFDIHQDFHPHFAFFRPFAEKPEQRSPFHLQDYNNEQNQVVICLNTFQIIYSNNNNTIPAIISNEMEKDGNVDRFFSDEQDNYNSDDMTEFLNQIQQPVSETQQPVSEIQQPVSPPLVFVQQPEIQQPVSPLIVQQQQLTFENQQLDDLQQMDWITPSLEESFKGLDLALRMDENIFNQEMIEKITTTKNFDETLVQLKKHQFEEKLEHLLFTFSHDDEFQSILDCIYVGFYILKIKEKILSFDQNPTFWKRMASL